MGRKMKSAPVYFTIAQIRVHPILSVLDSYPPQIQDRLRKEGFPDFQKALLATINLNMNVAPTSEGSPPQSCRWRKQRDSCSGIWSAHQVSFSIKARSRFKPPNTMCSRLFCGLS